MLTFFAEETVRANARTLAGLVGTDTRDGSFEEERNAYLQALNRVQSRRFAFRRTAEPSFMTDHAGPETAALLRHFLSLTEAGADNALPTDHLQTAIQGTAEGLGLLTEISDAEARIARFVIASYLLAHKNGAGGGSSGDQLGVVWLNPPRTWMVADYAEAILHESVHQALFLDEMINRVYAVDSRTMSEPENSVVSAIRRERRPYDASFHAACVAVELLEFFEKAGLHERYELVAEGVRQTVPELEDRAHVLTEHGRSILGELSGYLADISEGRRVDGTLPAPS